MSFGSISRLVRCPSCKRQHTSPVNSTKKRKAPEVCSVCGASLDGGVTSYRASVWVSGKQERKTWETLSQCQVWLREMRQQKVEVESGAAKRKAETVGEKPDITFGEIEEEFTGWIEHGRDRKPTEWTLTGYKKEWALVLKWWKKVRIADATPEKVQEYRQAIASLAAQTQRNRLGRLSQAIQYAVGRGYIPEAPCKVARPRPHTENPRHPATEEEISRALKRSRKAPGGVERIDAKEARASLLLAFVAGLRRFEIPPLTGDDIQTADGWTWIRIRQGKGRKTRRVPVTESRLADALSALSPAAGLPLFGRFSSESGLVHLLNNEYGDAAPGLHRCRHRAITTWANNPKFPLFKVQLWAGHADIRTTQGYVHMDDAPPAAVRPPKQNMPPACHQEKKARRIGGPRKLETS